jgi:hypothetical protein
MERLKGNRRLRRLHRIERAAWRTLRWLLTPEGLVTLWAVAICIGVWFGTSSIDRAVADQARAVGWGR